MMRGTINGLIRTRGIEGPWTCTSCGHLSQYADITSNINRIFCRNPECDFYRIVDKRNCLTVEPDGSHWRFDNQGRKWRVRPQ